MMVRAGAVTPRSPTNCTGTQMPLDHAKHGETLHTAKCCRTSAHRSGRQAQGCEPRGRVKGAGCPAAGCGGPRVGHGARWRPWP